MVFLCPKCQWCRVFICSLFTWKSQMFHHVPLKFSLEILSALQWDVWSWLILPSRTVLVNLFSLFCHKNYIYHFLFFFSILKQTLFSITLHDLVCFKESIHLIFLALFSLEINVREIMLEEMFLNNSLTDVLSKIFKIYTQVELKINQLSILNPNSYVCAHCAFLYLPS